MKDLIIPSYEFLRSVLKDDASVVSAIRRCTWLLKQDLGKNLRPNVELLQSYAVPDDRIAVILRFHPRAMLQSADGFRMVVEEVKEMGFEPVKSHFITACQVKCGLSKTMWVRKWDCFKKWGWSDDEILAAFMKQPNIMAVSEKKVDRVMDFLVNKMRWDISKVTCCPIVVMHSLENWTVPRCLIIQFLLSKGLETEDFPLNRVIVSTESRFQDNYVEKYSAEFPELLEMYENIKKNNTKEKVT
ncbi:transcription termination factor MTERF6, chloroplastic/mitochondrial-like [Heracleum sosnowskyi]|uniref:Transcription termination factor MTERF6, chloroplastic/mitochondrial-like n=1 Tax=Heracleum sosnowskyi TaxID=360622 RepID=A0AAD8HSN7_9APIA|nr:transcription termination factor MTERF6, chloroplastic/mitochondrial-like [Heracleum sosnowskyi]